MKICAIGLRGMPHVMGGIETHCENLYPRLARMDETLEITVIGRSGYAVSGRFGDVRVISLWAPRRRALQTLVHTPLAILYARLFLHPDIIHLHAVGPGFFVPLARLLGFRVIGTHHAADYDRPKWGRFGKWFLRLGEGMMARFANEVICVSQTIETRIADKHPRRRDRFTTIHNGAPPPATVDEDSSELLASLGLQPQRYVVCVGRLDPTKGFHDLIEAFRLARPRDLKLLVVGGSIGSDAYAEQLQRTAPSDVVFAGQRSAGECRTLYTHAALFVHPSHLEGFPLVVMEALAANAPILASDIPEHVEIGLEPHAYYPVGDVAALARKLGETPSNFLCRRRAAILEENDWGVIARRHRDVMMRHVLPPAPSVPGMGSYRS